MKGSKVTLTDNGSKFGSFVDGRRLSANQKVELSIGSELKFGQGPTTGTFKLVPMQNVAYIGRLVHLNTLYKIVAKFANLLSAMLSNVQRSHVYLHMVLRCSIAASSFSFLRAGWCMSHLYSVAPVWAGRKSRESNSWQKHYVMHYYYYA